MVFVVGQVQTIIGTLWQNQEVGGSGEMEECMNPGLRSGSQTVVWLCLNWVFGKKKGDQGVIRENCTFLQIPHFDENSITFVYELVHGYVSSRLKLLPGLVYPLRGLNGVILLSCKTYPGCVTEPHIGVLFP